MNDFEERGKEFKPTRTLKGLMVEFKGPYMSDEDWDKPETYKGILVALSKHNDKAIVRVEDDCLNDEERVNMRRQITRLAKECPDERHLTPLKGELYQIVIRYGTDRHPVLHQQVACIPDDFDIVPDTDFQK